jgi:hypothetical protein
VLRVYVWWEFGGWEKQDGGEVARLVQEFLVPRTFVFFQEGLLHPVNRSHPERVVLCCFVVME